MPESRAPSAAASGTFRLSDLEVHRLGYGAMRLCGPNILGEPDDPDQARRVLRRAVELGIDLIDTADSYGPEVNERQIAEALHPYPEGLVIATKGGTVRPWGRWDPDGRPEHLKRACTGSLRRLKLERIDLDQLHTPDPRVPFEESVGALAELQAEGKIRHIGISNVDIDELETARSIVDVVSVQNRYNLKDRSSEPVLERCEELGIGFLPWFPLSAGDLSGAGGALAEIAEAHQSTTAQIALAWLLARSPVVVPIPGTSSIEHLEQNVAAAEIELTDREIEQLAR